MLTTTRNVRHWLATAMASSPPAFVNRMMRRWISRQAFGTERFSSQSD